MGRLETLTHAYPWEDLQCIVRSSRSEPIDDVVQQIYEAALDPSAWERPLREIARRIRATRPGLILQCPEPGAPGRWIRFDSDPAFDHTYPDYWRRFEEATHAWASVPVGRVAMSSEMVAAPVLRASELYNDWLLPQGHRHWVTGMVWRHGPLAGGFGFFRDRGQRDFGTEELDLLRRLMPHFQQAFRLHQRIEQLGGERRTLAGLLDAFPVGVILVNGQGHTLEANRRAEELLRANDGLGCDGGTLRAAVSSSTRALRHLVVRAAATGSGNDTEVGGALLLSRPSGRRPLEVLVVSLGRDTAGALAPSRPAAAVFVGDPEVIPVPPEDKLRQLYGLTHAEARVALALARGQTTAEIAARTGVQPNTVRWHIKQLLAKTGTRRQAELVRLLLTGPLALFDT